MSKIGQRHLKTEDLLKFQTAAETFGSVNGCHFIVPSGLKTKVCDLRVS